MDRTRKIRLISNSFYNAGLERAKRRDLTGAVEYLKKCLNLNKYHIDARNLLGLIYYEMGEVSEALVQWVISMNFREQDNRADYYLDQIQRKQDRKRAISYISGILRSIIYFSWTWKLLSLLPLLYFS